MYVPYHTTFHNFLIELIDPELCLQLCSACSLSSASSLFFSPIFSVMDIVFGDVVAAVSWTRRTSRPVFVPIARTRRGTVNDFSGKPSNFVTFCHLFAVHPYVEESGLKR